MKTYKSILSEKEKNEFFHWEERLCRTHGQTRHLVSNFTNIGSCTKCAKDITYKPAVESLKRITEFQERMKSLAIDNNPFPELPPFEECLEEIRKQL